MPADIGAANEQNENYRHGENRESRPDLLGQILLQADQGNSINVAVFGMLLGQAVGVCVHFALGALERHSVPGPAGYIHPEVTPRFAGTIIDGERSPEIQIAFREM
jgi:hypothetical protein